MFEMLSTSASTGGLELIAIVIKDMALVIMISVLMAHLKYEENRSIKLLFICLLFLL